MSAVQADFSQVSMPRLAAIIAGQLASYGVEVVLVGGLAVEIYTENLYLTKDIDMVDLSYGNAAMLEQAMAELGFHKRGRYFRNSSTQVLVEFPSAPLAVGDELITESTTIKGDFGEVPILYAIDVVKDRLAAYFHWQDQQSLVQALCVMLCHQIELTELENFCLRESDPQTYAQLLELQRALSQAGSRDMAAIEAHVVAEQLKHL